MRFRLFYVLTCLSVTACVTTQTGGNDEQCKNTDREVKRFWNAGAKTQIAKAFGSTGLAYSKNRSEMVFAQMDQITRDWIALEESLCRENLVGGGVSKETYALRSACYDEALIRIRTLVEFLENADATTVDRAVDVFTNIQGHLEACKREAFYTAYREDVVHGFQDAVRFAEKNLAKASTALTLGKKKETVLAAEDARKAAAEANSVRLSAEVLVQEGKYAREYARYEEARDKFDEAFAISHKAGYTMGQADALHGIARVLDREAKFEQALENYERAERLYVNAVGKDSRMHAAVLNNIGGVWGQLGQNEKAIGFYEQALAINKRILGNEHPLVAVALANIGMSWHESGAHEKAIEFLEQALEIDRKVYGNEGPDIARILNNLGGCWGSLGSHEKALGFYEKALEVFRKVYGREHPDSATCLNNIGMEWLSLGNYEKAIGIFEQAQMIFVEVYGDEHPAVAATINNIGGAWMELGEYEKALKYFERAIALQQRKLPADHPSIKASKDSMELCRKKLGR